MGLFVKKEDTSVAQGYYVVQTGKTKLIVGLGNVGDQYENTRHNVGFKLVEAFASQHHGVWSHKKALKADVSEVRLGEQRVVLAKPTTMMNLSGEAVQALQRFYKISNDDTLIIYDDKDLPLGTIRVRVGGGDGGHNGIKSLLVHCKDGFTRLRIGVANELTERMDTAEFVLSRFTKAEQTRLSELGPKISSKIESFISDNLEAHSEHHD